MLEKIIEKMWANITPAKYMSQIMIWIFGFIPLWYIADYIPILVGIYVLGGMTYIMGTFIYVMEEGWN